MRYDIEADWKLLTTCNYRCDYCFLSDEALGAKLIVHASNETWAEAFAATGKTWLLHLTGGEPSVYPEFADLCERISLRHYLSLNTNLTHRSLDEFAERLNPQRVHFINAAVHYEERQKRGGLDVFFQRAQRLKERGFHVLTSVLMTPAMLEIYPQVSDLLEQHGFFPYPKTLRGIYQGKRYPFAYSEEEKEWILSCLLEARRRYAPLLARMNEPPTLNLQSDAAFLECELDYRGKLCGSGYNFVAIDTQGDVARCSSGQILGNILQKNLRLLESPQPCDTTYCPYFCEKYTSPRFSTPRAAPSSAPPGLLRRLFSRANTL